jgi:ABC-2 type transport system ATP-binding protein
MINVSHITKRYRQFAAVQDVSFAIERGDVVGLLGPNGAGKTTTLRIIAGFLAATEGQVTVAGFDVQADSLATRQRIGYLPETVPLYSDMRVDEYLRYRARIKRLPAKRTQPRLAEVRRQCGLSGMGRSLIGTLSRGYRQRVGLADALIHDPDVLILDEPTLGLDPAQRVETVALLRQLAERHTIILCSHLLEEVDAVCNRLIVLQDGRLVADDTPAGLKAAHPGRSWVRAEVQADADAVRQALAADVRLAAFEVTPLSEGWLTCRVRPRSTEEGWAAEWMTWLRDQPWPLRSVAPEPVTLEAVYLRLTQSDQPMAQGGSQP